MKTPITEPSYPRRATNVRASLRSCIIACALIAGFAIAACADNLGAQTSESAAALSGATRYEAENATTNLPTETVWPGYSGVDYVCCWASQGQYITFNVQAAAAGPYTLAFGYSAGNGAASRQLKLNGSVLAANQGFPGTANWSTWTTLNVQTNLNAGANTVTLTFDSPSGSNNYINIDYLDVAPASSSTRYEAENATTNLPTETVWPGYSGVDYVCCWASQGQYITFNFQAPTAGTYTLGFAYSAGNGNATRQLKLNGAVISANQTFPGTANWSTWTKLNVTANLNAGANSTTLTFDSPSGSNNYINIDYLDVTGGGSGGGTGGGSGSGGGSAGGSGGSGGQHEYNDTDSSIVFSRASNGPVWTYGSGSPEDASGDEHFTNVYSSSFAINFRGTDFQWIGKKGPNFGIATVYVDGVSKGTIDNYNSSTLSQQVLFNITGLSNAPHVFRAAIGGYPSPAKNSASSNTYQVLDAYKTSGTPLVLATYAASGSSVVRAGTWTCGANGGDLSNSHCWSNVPGSTMSLTFNGTGVEVYERPDGENGYTDVYMDNTFLYSHDSFGLPYDSDCDDCVNAQGDVVVSGLASGQHTLKLVVSTNKNPASEDRYTQIDEFMVMP